MTKHLRELLGGTAGTGDGRRVVFEAHKAGDGACGLSWQYPILIQPSGRVLRCAALFAEECEQALLGHAVEDGHDEGAFTFEPDPDGLLLKYYAEPVGAGEPWPADVLVVVDARLGTTRVGQEVATRLRHAGFEEDDRVRVRFEPPQERRPRP